VVQRRSVVAGQFGGLPDQRLEVLTGHELLQQRKRLRPRIDGIVETTQLGEDLAVHTQRHRDLQNDLTRGLMRTQGFGGPTVLGDGRLEKDLGPHELALSEVGICPVHQLVGPGVEVRRHRRGPQTLLGPTGLGDLRSLWSLRRLVLLPTSAEPASHPATSLPRPSRSVPPGAGPRREPAATPYTGTNLITA